MATFNLVVLSSSPLRNHLPDEPFRAISSSPSFPSPWNLLGKQSHVRNDIRVGSIPKTASVLSTTSANLRQSDIVKRQSNFDSVNSIETSLYFDNGARAKRAAEKEKTDDQLLAEHGNEKRPRKAATKKSDMEPEQEAAPKEKAARKSRAKKCDMKLEQEGVPPEKLARKAKTKKDGDEGQTTIVSGKVTKASGGLCVKKVSRKRQTATVSSHFASVVTDSLEESETPSANDMLLREAVKRRMNWTPTKPTATSDNISDGANLDELAGSEISSAELAMQKGFTDLLGHFGYTREAETPLPIKSTSPTTNRKRKLIELIKTHASAESPLPIGKVKAVKKKPRTITGLATAAYAIEDEDVLATPAPLLRYFPKKNLEGHSESITPDGFIKPAKPRSKSTPKGAIKTSRSKKAATAVQPLFSPESALKQSRRQEFVFGTSSQLAREDSPTLLRDLHQAMIASNKIEDDSFTEFDESASMCVTSVGTAAIPVPKKSLWSAASWADDDYLINVELDRATAEVALPVEQSILQYPSTQARPVESRATMKDTEVWYDLEENLNIFESPAPPLSVSAGHLDSTFQPELPNSSASTKAISSNATKVGKKSSVKSVKLADNDNLATMPDFKSYPTFRLAKEVASYQFKPVKSRDQMISLLERCWQGKQRTVLGALGTSSLQNQPSLRVAQQSLRMASRQAGSPKKVRGRPRKVSSASTASSNITAKVGKPSTKEAQSVKGLQPGKDEIPKPQQTPSKSRQRRRSITVPEEISDSDSPLTPSPPRRSRSKASSPPLPLELSIPDEVADNVDVTMSPGAEQRELHKHIMRAIKSAPRSNDPHNPSWHEKILLFDPIVLEDLTTWLNTGGLQNVGWDGEVSPAEVKKWCWKRSICCLWKVNLRGVARTRM